MDCCRRWAIVAREARRHPWRGGFAWLAIAAPAWLAATRSFAVWATSGLETRLFELFVVAAAFRLAGEIRARLAGGQSPRSVAAFERQADACIAHDVLGVLAILQTPTLVLTGEDDILTPPRYGRALAAMLGRAELGLLTGVGHTCLLESPKPFAERPPRK